MKKTLFGFVLGVGLTALLAFTPSALEPRTSMAHVEEVNGVLIFTDSKPVMPYDSLGTVELSFVTDTQYQSIRNHLLKKAKKRYPNVQGLIMKMNKKGVDKAMVVVFK
jgi:hypothetical protein